MIIEYDVSCFDRVLVIKCDNIYAEHKREIKQILEKAYLDWHSPEDIEDAEEREWVENDACCEEYMMSKLSETYPAFDEYEWDTIYYGNDEDEIEEEEDRNEYNHNYNIRCLSKVIDTLEELNWEFEPFEKLGNEAYHTVADFIKRLKELRRQNNDC